MNDLLESLLGLVIVGIIIVLAISFNKYMHKKDIKKDINTYNNGICKCGGHLEFINYTEGYGTHAYVFQCDSCNKIIKFNTNPLN